VTRQLLSLFGITKFEPIGKSQKQKLTSSHASAGVLPLEEIARSSGSPNAGFPRAELCRILKMGGRSRAHEREDKTDFKKKKST
jgi:hypothetical protein